MERIQSRPFGVIGKGLLASSLLTACGPSPSSRTQTQTQTTPPVTTTDDGMPTGVPPMATMTDPPRQKPGSYGAAVQFLASGSRLKVTTTYTQAGLRFLAVGTDGTCYGTKDGQTGQGQMWVSTDNARTWHMRGDVLDGANFRVLTVLHNGTLLADTQLRDGSHMLQRSSDQAHTWTPVLNLGTMTILTPHCVDELDGTVYLAEYQAYTNDSVPVHVWGSTDNGKSWETRATFTDRRHAHGLRVDQATHSIWVFFGDNMVRTGMVRSTDGWHFDPIVTGAAGSAVDAVFTERGMMFGQDLVYSGGTPSSLSLMGTDDEPKVMARLPGPSYSIHATPVGGAIVGTTREPGGDVYAPGDDSGHILVSADGVTWDDVLQYPRIGDTAYGRVNVYWALKSNELVVSLSDVSPIGSGYGFQLLKVEAEATK